MKDYATTLNRANTAPNSAATPFKGTRAPVPFTSAGGEHDPNQNPHRPNPPTIRDSGVNNPPPYAAEVVEANEKD